MRNARKEPSAICGQGRSRLASAFAQADQDIRCPLTESMDTVMYKDK